MLNGQSLDLKKNISAIVMIPYAYVSIIVDQRIPSKMSFVRLNCREYLSKNNQTIGLAR